MKILFVCTGNTCRSPMAEVILKKIKPEYEVISRGTSVIGIHPATPEAKDAVAKMGLSLKDHVSIQLEAEDIWENDLTVTMTGAQRDFLRELIPMEKDKIYALGDLAGTECDVCDPFGAPAAVYEACAAQIDEMIRLAIERKAL